MKECSPKSYGIAVALSAIFGTAGIHLFYLGRFIEGTIDLSLLLLTLYFLSVGNVGLGLGFLAIDIIHTFIITILLLIGAFKDGEGKVVCYPGQKLT